MLNNGATGLRGIEVSDSWSLKVSFGYKALKELKRYSIMKTLGSRNRKPLADMA